MSGYPKMGTCSSTPEIIYSGQDKFSTFFKSISGILSNSSFIRSNNGFSDRTDSFCESRFVILILVGLKEIVLPMLVNFTYSFGKASLDSPHEDLAYSLSLLTDELRPTFADS